MVLSKRDLLSFPYPGTCGDSEASSISAPSCRANNFREESTDLLRQISELQLKLQIANTQLKQQDSKLVFAEDRNNKPTNALKVKCVTETSLKTQYERMQRDLDTQGEGKKVLSGREMWMRCGDN